MMKLELSGVPETMLWPLWSRAAETRRVGGVLNDPMSADLVKRIDYDFIGRFGVPTPFLAIRARAADEVLEAHIRKHADDSIVIALGEGLETQLWRLPQSPGRWISVDLPEASEIRRRVLPEHPVQELFAGSALEASWMDGIDPEAAPLISAAGLLMYFQPRDVRRLLAMIIERFPNASMFFDTIPPATSLAAWRGLRLTPFYRSPPMPWGVRIRDVPAFVRSIPGWKLEWVKSYGEAFPQRTPLSWAFSQTRNLRGRLAPGLCFIKGQR